MQRVKSRQHNFIFKLDFSFLLNLTKDDVLIASLLPNCIFSYAVNLMHWICAIATGTEMITLKRLMWIMLIQYIHYFYISLIIYLIKCQLNQYLLHLDKVQIKFWTL